MSSAFFCVIRMQRRSGSRNTQRGRTRHLQEKLPEQTVESWMRIRKATRCPCAHPAETDLRIQNAHADSGYMFANPGLDTEAHKDPHISDHSRHDVNIKSRQISFTETFFPQFIYGFHMLFPLLPRHFCLKFVVLKITYIYLLILQPLWFSFIFMFTEFSLWICRELIIAPLLPFKDLQL